VRIVPDINGEGLVHTLLKLADTAGNAERPVLLLTNDRMVEVVGRHAETIARHYRLSWAHTADALVPLLGKDRIEARCRETGLNYPRSLLLTDFADAPRQLATLDFPVIAKPTRPVSAFKTQVAQSVEAFLAARPRMEKSMPLLVQEFISGDDRVIRFGALYLDRGRVLARFEGRKLRSRPMGHTTIAVPEPDDAIHALAVRFFDGLELSGPVSLELKQDPDGRYWVIEPTLGRSDFWAGLCAANGVDLAFIEYRAQTGEALPAVVQRRTHLWINGERDPGALAWLLRHAPAQLFSHWPRGVYFDLRDPRPWLLALGRFLGAMPLRAMRKAGRLVTGGA
jgi:predicted ATP-grasp superfamily ATP-dependent carboligase